MAAPAGAKGNVRCTVCTHPKMSLIDQWLVSGHMATVIARRVGLNHRAVQRHRLNHLSPAIAAVAKKDEKRVRGLLGRVENLVDSAEQIMDTAKASGRPQLALSAIREMRESLKLLGQASGELKPDGATTVQVLNVQQSPEWLAIRTAMLTALDRFPEAKEAVLEALTPSDTSGNPQIPSRPHGEARREIVVSPYRPEKPEEALIEEGER